jgi:hypothetical protein
MSRVSDAREFQKKQMHESFAACIRTTTQTQPEEHVQPRRRAPRKRCAAPGSSLLTVALCLKRIKVDPGPGRGPSPDRLDRARGSLQRRNSRRADSRRTRSYDSDPIRRRPLQIPGDIRESQIESGESHEIFEKKHTNRAKIFTGPVENLPASYHQAACTDELSMSCTGQNLLHPR